MGLNDLRLFKYLSEKDPKLASQVESVYNATKDTIDGIAGCYYNYTMHNTGHSLRVANYMGELACGVDSDFEHNLEKYNAFEIALMILSALLHDIGMFIRPEDKDRITNGDIPYTNSLTFAGVMSVVNNNQEEAIKEIVRITHAQRIREYIDYEFGDKKISSILRLEDKYGYADDVVDICVGHGEDYDYLRNLRTQCTKGKYTYNLQYIAVMLRIADYLDLDSQRTPVLWYKIMRIEGFSKDEWEKHFVVHNEKKLKKYIGNELQIYFEGKSSNAKIHRKYLAYVDEIRAELERADALLNQKNAEEKYLFHVSPKVEDCVVTEGFKYSDLRLNLDYSSITDLLMGNNIYGNKQLGLRELIQNALDACELMKEIQEKNGDDDAFTPQISILISKKKGYVKIKDTGTGMTLEVVKKHFLNVGRSYYKSNEFKYENYDYKPIGQFGIGFLACFLLSDNVTVKTKYYKSNEVNQIELEKNSEYVVTNTEETGNFCGTEITLDYSKFFEVFPSETALAEFIRKYFYSSVSIVVKDVDERREIVRSTLSGADMLSMIDRDGSNVRYEDIECNRFSNAIEGTIRIRDAQRKTVFDVRHIAGTTMYLFNNETKKMDLVTDEGALITGYYRMVNYTLIDEKLYSKIKATRKASKNKRNEILVLSAPIYFLFSENVDYSYAPTPKGYRVTVNGVTLEEVLQESGLPYYSELVDEFEYYKPIYIANRKYIELQENDLYGPHYVSADSESLMFYNKGVWIRDVFNFSCLLPAAYKMKAVLNYIDNGIKLDVSRNRVLGGRQRIEDELMTIMLQYMLEKGVDFETESMINSMIEYLRNRRMPTKAS